MSSPDFAQRPPWTRPGFIAAAVLLLAVILIGVLVAVFAIANNGRSGATATSTPTPGSTPADSSTTAPGAPEAVPTAPPADVRWELVGQTAVPVSASSGPSRTGETAAGYAHTPEGALIAAAQISTRAAYSAGRQSWEPTIQQQFEPNADRDRLLAALREAGDTPADPGELSQIAGFSYQSYTPDTAVIGLVFRAPSAGTPRYHVLSLTLLWRDGDWRMMPPPGGSWTSINRMTSDLIGVVEWGAR
ncbi:hypothetical protein AB0B71_28530 [Micromonospora echinofusca]|uniref:hypothetical protein n=1 Tax=Micromonospora echinofusca TaxID=47858 RepID=UPI0034042AF7